MQYTTLRDPAPIPRKPPSPKAPQIQRPDTPERPKAKDKSARRCPSGFRWDSKKGKCVQAGVGPQYRP